MHVRPLLAAALAALLAVPAAASAQARRGTTSPPAATRSSAAGARTLTGGAWLGYEMGDLDGVQLRVEGELPFQKLTPQVDLSLVAALSYSRLGDELAGDFDITSNLIKVVPAARFTLPLNPQLSVFGDAGLGLYYSSVSAERAFFNPLTNQIERREADDSTLGLMLRFGAGGLFAVNPRTKVGVQMVLDPMFGDDVNDTTFTLLAGLTYQL